MMARAILANGGLELFGYLFSASVTRVVTAVSVDGEKAKDLCEKTALCDNYI